MKTTNFLKSIAITAVFAISGSIGMAQVISSLPTYNVATDSSSLADTVSVGSVMPYFVNPDATIKSSSLHNPSGFEWTAGAGITLNSNASGGALTVSPVGAGYYSDTLVYATFPGTAGALTISTTEKSNPKYSATAGCVGNTRNLTVAVIALPAIPTIAATDTAQGGCSASAPYTVKFNFSASTTKFPAYVSYTVKAFDVSGSAIGTAQTYYYQINTAAGNIVVPQSQLDAASGGTNVNGKYTVTLGNLWDRISVRAANASAIGVDASALSASIYVLPTPQTGIIKHIKTL